MAVLIELTAFLVGYSPSLSLTASTNLFRGVLPPTPDLAVALYEYGGFANEPVLGGSTINIQYPAVQVAVRGVKDDYDTPRALIGSIEAAFATVGDSILSGIWYGAVTAKQPPFLLHWDENHRAVFVCNFQITKNYS